MRAPGAVQVLRSAQAARQSRRPWPPPGHVRLHAASCCVQALGHAAAALPLVAASDRPTIPTRNPPAACIDVRRVAGAPDGAAIGLIRERDTATLRPSP